MSTILTALAQINPSVGALSDNADKIRDFARIASDRGASIIVFPELCLSGYPPEDLILKPHFIRRCRAVLEDLLPHLPPHAVVIVGAPEQADGGVANAAFVIHRGGIAGIYRKMLLPNYGVFDEKRVFVAGDRPLIIDAMCGDGILRAAIHICEDTWLPDQSPCSLLRGSGVDVILNLSASPFHHRKMDERQRVLGRAARSLDAALCYANLVGGQDELVFDGTSLALNPDGSLRARAKPFEEDILLVPLDASGPAGPAPVDALRIEVEIAPASAAPACEPRVETVPDECEEIYLALVTGLRDYVEKNRFPGAIVAISGGIDSALVAAVAVDALGADRVSGITMPSRYSSEATVTDARKLAESLGIELAAMPIEPVYTAFLESLAPLWPGRRQDVTEENLQARIRGAAVMALSNKFGMLVLSTGNKSELATGYCTLYGDMVGGFAVLKDVFKTWVFRLAAWRNERESRPVIPPSILTRPPSAELRADQRDTDSLPPYEVLDPILERIVERDFSRREVVEDGFDEDLVKRVVALVDRSEYKRRQGAPGIRISPKAFGRDRRLPITNGYRG
jgi:NAD+ synthase (glutamine-hydrolysing)